MLLVAVNEGDMLSDIVSVDEAEGEGVVETLPVGVLVNEEV
jgi:hypothetical protein